MEKLEQLMDKEIVPLIISFDIAGVFDFASWEIIVQTTKRMNCPAYLINLIALYPHKRKVKLLGTDRTIRLSQGSPQWSGTTFMEHTDQQYAQVEPIQRAVRPGVCR